jgi:hypothetical protein
MTTTPDLDQLERDLEETRERLSRDLDRLRSTETISGFKADLLAQVSETKDDLVGKAKASVTAGAQDLWDEVKARAAANPAAALAPGRWACLAPFAPAADRLRACRPRPDKPLADRSPKTRARR